MSVSRGSPTIIGAILAALLGIGVAPAEATGAAAGGRERPGGSSVVPGVDLTTLDTTLGAQDLTDLTFLPSGDLLVAGRKGVVKRVTPEGRATTLARLDVETSVNRGLSSITLAPDYERTGRVYTLASYREGGERIARLERFVVNDPRAPRTMRHESIVLDDIPDAGYGHHTVGAVRVAPDGSLLVSMGDEGHPGAPKHSNFRALDPGYPGGKILRVTPRGRGVPDNPYFDLKSPDSWESRVYARGFRNPFRFAIRPATGAVYVGDVGARARETLAVVAPGTNLGWPCFEGGEPQTVTLGDPRCAGVAPPVAPLWTYPRPRSPAGAAIVAGVFPPDESRWAGHHVFADFSQGIIYALPVDEGDHLTPAATPAVIARGSWHPVSLSLDGNGDVCFADHATAKVRCLVDVGSARR
jgi:glucose/arabinose dehydrogenase